VFDNFSVIEDIDEKRVNVILWDTAGQEDYVAVRRICYEQTGTEAEAGCAVVRISQRALWQACIFFVFRWCTQTRFTTSNRNGCPS
jgi:GTPase SAR1 family protein